MSGNLDEYFNFHICLSFHLTCVCRPAPILEAVLQNITNKSCLVYFESEKCIFGVTAKTSWIHGALWASPGVKLKVDRIEKNL